MNDDDLLDQLADLWRERDPVPTRLVARMQTYARAEADLLATDWDYELLQLVDRSSELVGTRSVAAGVTLQFATDDVDVLLRVADGPAGGGVTIDGWIVPSLPVRVRLTRLDDDHRTTVRAVDLVDDGRFVLDGLAPGLVRLHLEPVDDHPPLVTPTFEI